MEEFISEKECEKEEFNYDELWDENEDKEIKKKVETFSKGFPRTGLKGKYIKVKGRVSKRQVKNSYGKYFKGLKEN
jgi:hypothetical protein